MQFWPSITQLQPHPNPSASWCDPAGDPEAACEKPRGTGALVEFRLCQPRPFTLSQTDKKNTEKNPTTDHTYNPSVTHKRKWKSSSCAFRSSFTPFLPGLGEQRGDIVL